MEEDGGSTPPRPPHPTDQRNAIYQGSWTGSQGHRTAVKSTLLVNQLCSLEPISSFGMGKAWGSVVS
jgi:hypothetical protein